MTNRLVLAAACVAAASLACSQPPKSTAAPGARVASMPKKLGQFTMTVTPIAESGGRLARVDVVPDGAGGSVGVAGRFEASITSAGAVSAGGGLNPCGVQALYAPVDVINRSPELLSGVQVQITGMSQTGREACNSNGVAGALPIPADTAPGAAFGLWNYGALAGTAGGAAGTVTRGWWMKFPTTAPVSFSFAVWADPLQPELVSAAPELEVGLPLTWTSAGSATSRLELCDVDPQATVDGKCPTTPVNHQTLAAVAGAGVGPWTFTSTPATVAGRTYWWRAVNTFGVTPVAGRFPSAWDSFTAVAPFAPLAPVIIGPVAPANVFTADVVVNALPIPLDWTSDLTAPTSYYQVCSGACPAPGVITPGLVSDGTDIGTLDVGGFLHSLDVSALLPLDPATFNTWLLPGTYSFAIYNFDEVNAVAVGAPATGAFVVAPATFPAPEVLSPLPGQAFPADSLATLSPVPLDWTTDPAIGQAHYFLCSGPAAACPGAANLNVIFEGTAVGTSAGLGLPYGYTVDLTALLPTDPNAGGLWLLPGVYSAVVGNWDALTLAVVGPSTGVDFTVASSMPALPVLTGPAAGAAFPANAFAAATPIPLTWTSAPGVVATEIEFCDTVDCLPAGPLVGLLTFYQVLPAAGVYAADPAVIPDLTTEFAVTGGAYLEVGTYYYSVYNVDGTTGARLLPGVQSTFVISAVPTGPAAFTLVGTGANTSRGGGPISLSWTGPAAVGATTIEFYEDALLSIPAGTFIVPAATPGAFAIADLGPLLPADLAYHWRVVDDGLAAFWFGTPPSTLWSATGTFTIAP